MADGARPLHAALAIELDGVAASLEAAAVSLCVDPAIIARHAETLQVFDRLGQLVTEIAILLRSPDPADTLSAVRLEALRERLTLACMA